MRAYRDFSPTQFDIAGLGLEERQDWLVCPVLTNRDADLLTVSNWETVKETLRKIDPEEENHEVHRFGHWGPGWFEIILVKPGSACAAECVSFETALADYPSLDDNRYSDLEYNIAIEAIKQQRGNYHIAPGRIWSWLADNEPDELEHDGTGAYPSRESVCRAIAVLRKKRVRT